MFSFAPLLLLVLASLFGSLAMLGRLAGFASRGRFIHRGRDISYITGD